MMKTPFLITLGFAVIGAIGAPAPASTDDAHAAGHDNHTHAAAHDSHTHAKESWVDGDVGEFHIHESCNNSEVIQLRKGLADAVTLAEHAQKHILYYGNGSAHYQRYFGNATSGQVIGWYDKIVRGRRDTSLFRCDNPDRNCDLPEYGGHWRGSNATNETVICPLSFETRWPLEQLCAQGWTVAAGATNAYFGSDLLHRLYHLPAFGEGWVEHFTETYADVLAIGADNATYAVRDSDVLQYFALDVYAFDIILPQEGCSGDVEVAREGGTTTATEAAGATTAPSTAEDTGTASAAAAETTEAPPPTAVAAQAPSPTLSIPPVESFIASEGGN